MNENSENYEQIYSLNIFFIYKNIDIKPLEEQVNKGLRENNNIDYIDYNNSLLLHIENKTFYVNIKFYEINLVYFSVLINYIKNSQIIIFIYDAGKKKCFQSIKILWDSYRNILNKDKIKGLISLDNSKIEVSEKEGKNYAKSHNVKFCFLKGNKSDIKNFINELIMDYVDLCRDKDKEKNELENEKIIIVANLKRNDDNEEIKEIDESEDNIENKKINKNKRNKYRSKDVNDFGYDCILF